MLGRVRHAPPTKVEFHILLPCPLFPQADLRRTADETTERSLCTAMCSHAPPYGMRLLVFSGFLAADLHPGSVG